MSAPLAATTSKQAILDIVDYAHDVVSKQRGRFPCHARDKTAFMDLAWDKYKTNEPYYRMAYRLVEVIMYQSGHASYDKCVELCRVFAVNAEWLFVKEPA